MPRKIGKSAKVNGHANQDLNHICMQGRCADFTPFSILFFFFFFFPTIVTFCPDSKNLQLIKYVPSYDSYVKPPLLQFPPKSSIVSYVCIVLFYLSMYVLYMVCIVQYMKEGNLNKEGSLHF